MKSEHTYVPEVDKENLAGMIFPSNDVLPLGEQRAERRKLLERAIDFGNYAHYKVAILFEDNEGPKRVETTIWDIDDKNIYLKNRITVPLHRILEVKV